MERRTKILEENKMKLTLDKKDEEQAEKILNLVIEKEFESKNFRNFLSQELNNQIFGSKKIQTWYDDIKTRIIEETIEKVNKEEIIEELKKIIIEKTLNSIASQQWRKHKSVILNSYSTEELLKMAGFYDKTITLNDLEVPSNIKK